MPDVVLRNILQRDKLKNFKREEHEVFRAFKITPVEIIDGIDSEIRVRLDDHHIHSTQNLAAANPLMLFVETPYGVYQIMDWVAQAQLCCSVGREKSSGSGPWACGPCSTSNGWPRRARRATRLCCSKSAASSWARP